MRNLAALKMLQSEPRSFPVAWAVRGQRRAASQRRLSVTSLPSAGLAPFKVNFNPI